MTIIKIRVSNGFNGTTSLTAGNMSLTKEAGTNDVWVLTDANNASFANLGRIPMALLATALPAREHLLQNATISAAVGVTSFSMTAGLDDAGTLIAAGPTREVDPAVTTRVGDLMFSVDQEMVIITSGAVGASAVFIELHPVDVRNVVSTIVVPETMGNGGVVDATAIHVNVAGEIEGIDAKATPVTADLLLIEDSAGGFAKAKITIGDLPAQAGADSTAVHVDVAAEISAISAKANPEAADFLLIEDAADSDAKARITIGTIPVAQAQVASGIREIANDGAVALLNTDTTVIIADSTTGVKAITTTSSYAGQRISIRLQLATGNSYTLAVQEGTLTFDGAGEEAVIVRNAADDAWLVALLLTATIV
jgi:hypothetical protein